MTYGQMIDELLIATGKYVHLETSDGVLREGKYTGHTTRLMKINNQEVHIPIDIELNGDAMDRVPYDRIVRIEID